MTEKRDARGTLRDYEREYRRFQSSKKAKRERAARNTARRRAKRAGLVHKGDKKEVDHKDSIAMHNNPSNLRVVSRTFNRSRKENSRRRGSRRNRSSWGL